MTRGPTEMEQRCAKALWMMTPDGGIAWEDLGEFRQDFKIRQARMVIRAMREPTKEMVWTAQNDGNVPFGGAEAWGVMIDAASPPE